MNKQIQEQLDALQEKIDRQNGAIESYRRELLKVTDYKSERDLYSELSAAFALASSADEVFLKTLDALSGHLKASYYGVFFLDERKESFLYRHGKGYNPASMPTISAQGSLMGDCIFGDIFCRRLVARAGHSAAGPGSGTAGGSDARAGA